MKKGEINQRAIREAIASIKSEVAKAPDFAVEQLTRTTSGTVLVRGVNIDCIPKQRDIWQIEYTSNLGQDGATIINQRRYLQRNGLLVAEQILFIRSDYVTGKATASYRGHIETSNGGNFSSKTTDLEEVLAKNKRLLAQLRESTKQVRSGKLTPNIPLFWGSNKPFMFED